MNLLLMTRFWNQSTPAQWKTDKNCWKCSLRAGAIKRIYKGLYSHGLNASLQCI
jgi:hypothetical protein